MNISYPTPPAAAASVSNRTSTTLNQRAAANGQKTWPATTTEQTGPFLKWAGSKRRLLTQLLPLLPHGNRLIEPFVGGGSVFMSTDFEAYLLGDINPDLIGLYGALKRDPTTFVADAQALFVDANCNQAAYNTLRARFNDPFTPRGERAALFLYLNKFGFNGLYRVNKDGEMNVPFAHLEKVPGFPLAAIDGFAKKLSRAQLKQSDFAAVMEQAVPGDVVYCDPVYVGRDDVQGLPRKSFSAYDSQGFGLEQHQRLAQLARSLSNRGVPVVISNNDTAVTRALYAGAEFHAVAGYRSMAASTSARGKVTEMVAIFRG
jgi:DNA adenine methylase